MFNIKLSNYLSNINKINEISTNEIFNSFCFRIKLGKTNNLSQLLYNNFPQFFYWEQPENNYSFCAVHGLKQFIANGNNRAKETQKTIDDLNYLHYNNFDKFNLDFVPMYLGGMKFSPGNKSELWSDFNDSDWFVPKYMFLSTGDSAFFIYNFFFDKTKVEQIIAEGEKGLDYLSVFNDKQNIPQKFTVESSNFDKDYDKQAWINSVETALTKIQDGDIKKVVLSRKVKMEFKQTSNVSVLLTKLKENYPRCYIFAYGKSKSVFFGASPEKLAKLSDGYIEADRSEERRVGKECRSRWSPYH